MPIRRAAPLTTCATSWSPAGHCRPGTKPLPGPRAGSTGCSQTSSRPSIVGCCTPTPPGGCCAGCATDPPRRTGREPPPATPALSSASPPASSTGSVTAASRWPTAARPAGYPVRDFLGWAASHHHGPTLLVPTLGRTAGPAIAADDRWALVARLLHDDAVELTDRVAGAFLLCYGQQLSRIAVMTTAQVSRGHDIVSVRFGTGDITVPEPLAGLLTELIDTGRRYVGVGAPTASPWLFPGHLPGRPISPARLGERLRTLGIRVLPGRRATLLQLAAEVPAAVLADLLHLSVGTATRWTRDAGGDWACYAAELARSGGHGT